MANQHYNIKEDLEVNLTVKLSDIKISTYQYLSEEDIKESFKEFKKNISSHIVRSNLESFYYQQEVTDCVDWFSYDISELEENENKSKSSTSDKEHLQWLHNRMVEVYGESENVDFLIRMRDIINKM